MILAILPSVLGPIETTPGTNMRMAAWGIALVASVAFSLSAAASLRVLLIKAKYDIGIKGIVERWVDTTTVDPTNDDVALALDPGQVKSDYANAYFGRQANPTDSALMSIREQSQSKAKWLRGSQWASVVGIVLLGALLGTLVGARFDPVAPQKLPPHSTPSRQELQSTAVSDHPAVKEPEAIKMIATPLESLLGSGDSQYQTRLSKWMIGSA